MQEQNPPERKWHLAAKMLTSSLEPEEQAEWEAFSQDSQFREEFALVKKYWDQLGTLPYQQIDTAKDWQLVWEKAQQQAPTRSVRPMVPWFKYAAAISVCLITAFLVWWGSNQGFFTSREPISLTTIEAPAGSKTVVSLPDSSKIWLNAGSKVSFDNHFGTANRKISLDGEAFFDVIKNTLPFRVHTSQYDIAVLGTAFNVRAYRDDDKAITTLVRGSLKVQRTNAAGDQEEILLKPNEQLVLRKKALAVASTNQADSALSSALPPDKNQILTVEKGVNTEIETGWKDGWLSVRGESLDELAKKIERLYDVSIHFQDNELKKYRYTGRIRQLSLEQVLKALSLTSPIEFTIREKTVTLQENKSTKSKYHSLQTP